MVAELQKLFIATWEKQKGKPLAPRDYFPPLSRQGNEVVRAIGSSPDEPYSQIYATLISAIDSAETRGPADQRLLRARSAADGRR